MAIRKLKMNQRNSANGYDTLYPETSSDQVIDITTGETLAALKGAANGFASLDATGAIPDTQINDAYKIIKSDKDAEGIFTVVTYRRKSDNSLYCTSTLSGGTSPLYTTRTEKYYSTNGTTLLRTVSYLLTYDEDGVLVSEV